MKIRAWCFCGYWAGAREKVIRGLDGAIGASIQLSLRESAASPVLWQTPVHEGV